ncbi:MAG: hypothetical protein ABEI39_03250 [Halobacteriales archaeon]
MAALPMEARPPDDRLVRLERARLRYLGYLTYRQLLTGGAVAFLAVVGLIIVLPFGAFAGAFLAALLVLALELLAVGVLIAQSQRVCVRVRDGLYVARDRKTGLQRHGETAEEALENLAAELRLRSGVGR